MEARQRNELVLTSVLATASAVSFLTAYRGWTGRADVWFCLLLILGAVCIVGAFWGLSLYMRSVYTERQLRVPLIAMVRGPFTKEPPIRGKPPQ